MSKPKGTQTTDDQYPRESQINCVIPLPTYKTQQETPSFRALNRGFKKWGGEARNMLERHV